MESQYIHRTDDKGTTIQQIIRGYRPVQNANEDTVFGEREMRNKMGSREGNCWRLGVIRYATNI
jgi:hypothetical protein